MIRIFIADDHPLVRRGLKQTIAEEPDMEVVGEAQNGNELLALIKQHPGEVVILDMMMPGLSGLDLLAHLRQAYPQLLVLILSMHPEEQYAVRALKAGAAGYLTKEQAPEELVGAIRKVVSGGRYVSLSLAEKLAQALESGPEQPRHETLSQREFQVLCLLGAGKTVSEIAEELFLSVKTVSTYRSRLLEKMHLKNNAELIRYAVEKQLV